MNSARNAQVFLDHLAELIEKASVTDFFIVVPAEGKTETEYSVVHAIQADTIYDSTRVVDAAIQAAVKRMMESHGLTLTAAAGAIKGMVEEAERDIRADLVMRQDAADANPTVEA